MSFGISLFMIAVGAVLAFAVNYQVSGVDVAAIGWILMAVGALGVLMYFLFLATFAPFYRGDASRTEIIERPTTHIH